MRLSLKKQLQTIFNSACYTAFGQIPQMNCQNIKQQFRIRHIRYHNKIGYNVKIANAMYEVYRKDGFRFSDHGITPKGLAEDIEVHLIQDGDIEWQIDHFGNFIVTPTPQFVDKNSRLEEFDFIDIKQYHQNLQKFNKQKIHVFNFYADSSTTLGDLQRLKHMETTIRILSNFNRKKIVRKFFTSFDHNQSSNIKIVQKVAETLLQQKSPIKVQNFDNLLEKVTHEQSEINYFCCCPSNRIYFCNKLPNFQLFCPYVPEDWRGLVDKLNVEEMKEKLNKVEVWEDKNRRQQMQKLIDGADKGQIMIYFGDLLDEHKIEDLYLILKIIDERSDSHQFRLLKKALDKVYMNQ